MGLQLWAHLRPNCYAILLISTDLWWSIDHCHVDCQLIKTCLRYRVFCVFSCLLLAAISPAILVPRKRLSMLKNGPLARIWHNDYTNLCNNSTCRSVLGDCCRCWEQVQQFPRTSRTSISLFQINLTSESTTDKSRP